MDSTDQHLATLPELRRWPFTSFDGKWPQVVIGALSTRLNVDHWTQQLLHIHILGQIPDRLAFEDSNPETFGVTYCLAYDYV